jgi:molecular chaperone DnaK
MVRDREAHALDDLAYRRLVDVRNKAEPVLRATEQQMDDARRLLAADEYARVESCAAGLRTALEGQDPEAIQNAFYALKDVTTPLAERIIRDTIERAQRRAGESPTEPRG